MEHIDLLQKAMGDPWMLLYLAVWIVGFALKKWETIPSKAIPIVLFLVGIAVALVILEFSVAGAIIGAAVAALQMGLYDGAQAISSVVKPSKE